jgi:Holliday junction resolvase RusA-like endonuclease
MTTPRIRQSFGACHVNTGNQTLIDEINPYVLDNTRTFYLFDICPVSAPRMTQSDRWRLNPEHEDINKRQRPVVTKYFAYKNRLIAQAEQMKYEMKSVIEVLFLIPMPASWSEKKKLKMNGLPCKVKPDTDNLIKAIKDTFCKDDSHIWRETGEKRWAFKGCVIIFE